MLLVVLLLLLLAVVFVVVVAWLSSCPHSSFVFCASWLSWKSAHFCAKSLGFAGAQQGDGAEDAVLSRVARDYELLFRGFYSELRCETAAVPLTFARLRNLSPWTPLCTSCSAFQGLFVRQVFCQLLMVILL